MIVEVSVVPVGVGESLSEFVADAIKIIENSGYKYKLTPMGTVIEIENFEELGKLLDRINEVLVAKGAPRIYVVVKADYRVKSTSMEYKVESVMRKLKE